MHSLVADAPGRLSWQSVPEPRRQHEREAIVRPLAVARCDLDPALTLGVPHFPQPIHMGHECVAEVVEGPDWFGPGDRVVVPFQISCGTCRRCQRGWTGKCEKLPALSMYGFGSFGGNWGGMLSDLALVPYAEAMLLPLPEGVEPETVASVADNVPDGWRTVAPGLAEYPGADVLIVGGGAGRSIPLYAVDAAVALGASTVTYVDTDADRLSLARRLGAIAVEGEPEPSLGEFPITVNATATVDGLLATLRLTEPGGRCTTVGHLDHEATLPLWELWQRSVALHISTGQARAAMPAILDLVAAGRLRPGLVTSTVAAWDDAPEAMLEPATKLVISRS